MLRRIWRVNRNGTSHAANRENIGENHNLPVRLQFCNTVVPLSCLKNAIHVLSGNLLNGVGAFGV
jgi:hypothetical protein